MEQDRNVLFHSFDCRTIVGQTLHHIRLGTNFLNKTPKVQEIKSGINKWDGIKLKSSFTTKETIKNMKRQPTEWEEIFDSYSQIEH